MAKTTSYTMYSRVDPRSTGTTYLDDIAEGFAEAVMEVDARD